VTVSVRSFAKPSEIEWFNEGFRIVFADLLNAFDKEINSDATFAAAMDQDVEEGPPP
jgi:hypothetical protein